MENKLKIFIVDDHQIVRTGLTHFLNSCDNFLVCGEAEDANSAILHINNCDPDLVIVDISLKGTNGIELIKAIKLRYKEIKILVLSMHSESKYVEEAIDAGASGYVLKSESINQVVDAIENIMNNNKYLSDSLKDNLLDNILWKREKNSKSFLEKLSKRETEIFNLIGHGLNSKQISNELKISVSTIGTYREQIKRKLEIDTANQLVKVAVQFNLENKIV